MSRATSTRPILLAKVRSPPPANSSPTGLRRAPSKCPGCGDVSSDRAGVRIRQDMVVAQHQHPVDRGAVRPRAKQPKVPAVIAKCPTETPPGAGRIRLRCNGPCASMMPVTTTLSGTAQHRRLRPLSRHGPPLRALRLRWTCLRRRKGSALVRPASPRCHRLRARTSHPGHCLTRRDPAR